MNINIGLLREYGEAYVKESLYLSDFSVLLTFDLPLKNAIHEVPVAYPIYSPEYLKRSVRALNAELWTCIYSDLLLENIAEWGKWRQQNPELAKFIAQNDNYHRTVGKGRL
tara:strand:+ start:384 stop:716 length:333 start_codon:yes stop_codon:yes gene_type:complete